MQARARWFGSVLVVGTLWACTAASKAPTNAAGSSGDTPGDDDPAPSSSSSGSLAGRDGGPRAGDASAPETFDASDFDAGPGGDGDTCDDAHDIGALSGDTDGEKLTLQGNCDSWVRLRATENWAGATGAQMSVVFTLVSPSDENFDLEVYFDPDADALECTTKQGSSAEPASRSDVVRVAWGEGYLPNDGDDSRTLSVHVTGDCGGTENWTLLAEGHR